MVGRSKSIQLLLTSFILFGFLVVGWVIAQQDDEESLKGTSFQLSAEIGRAVPQRLIYDPNFERYAVVDAYGRLLLTDAETYETERVLYIDGQYNDLLFSNDGRWLALAINTRIELWDTNSGERVAFLDDLSQALRVTGPLAFADDDNLLLFNGIYPAPQALRRSENDTSTVPWLWNLTSARNEGESTFPRRVEALPFFDYRNGFTLGQDDKIVAALPGRLNVLDAYTTEVLFEIPTARFEQDPLIVWYSAQDDQIYVRTSDFSKLLQVDTERGLLVEIPMNDRLTLADLENIGALELSATARVIGEPATARRIPLLEIILGENYYRRAVYNDDGEFVRWQLISQTVTLIDILDVPFRSESQQSAFLFVFNEESQTGYFTLSRFTVQQMALSNDGDTVIIRRQDDENEVVETYDLDSGARLTSTIPALRNPNRYSPRTRNRVLMYTADESQIITDFERMDAVTGDSVASDLRYSRRFDRYFFTDDSLQIVTLSANEWRLWDIATGEVIERKVLNFRGNVVATSPDGYRYLTRFSERDGVGMEVYDVREDSRQSVQFDDIAGHIVNDVYYTPNWETFLVTYTVNSFGPYAPGNQVAGYGLDDGFRWLIAGDDLPFAGNRRYGWIDNQTAYVYGSGTVGDIPARIYGVDFELNGVPTCLTEQFENNESLRRLWWSELQFLDVDEAARLANLVCNTVDDPDFTPSRVRGLAASELNPTQTPVYIDGVPTCLTQRFPTQAEQYAQDWRAFTEGLSDSQKQEAIAIFCEAYERDTVGSVTVSGELTMMIDSKTGVRSIGNFTPPTNQRPISPVIREFERTEERNPGTVVLSPDERLIAVSNLPGELLIYEVVVGYQNLLAQKTATEAARFDAEQLVGALPTFTPTFAPIGTARPTLTPTPSLTPLPSPESIIAQPQLNETENLCPAQQLYTMDNLPPAYNATGRLIGPAGSEVLWVAKPENGDRYPDPNVPACGFTLDCTLSPDNAWILAYGLQGISVRRPDESEFRLLFDLEDPDFDYEPFNYDIPNVRWSGVDILEYDVWLRDDRNRRRQYIQQDILGVFPDPDPFIPVAGISRVRANILSRQPGGSLGVVSIQFTTGTRAGYEYFVYDFANGEWTLIARETQGELTFSWHPFGDRLFYHYPTRQNRDPVWYQYTVATGEFAQLGNLPPGVWSPDGRYRVASTNDRRYPVQVWDSATGLIRRYCIPETGTRRYDGGFWWSPDSEYIALRAPLPKDEEVEGVGAHLIVLDVDTGTMTDVTTGFGPLFMWAPDPVN